MYVEKVLDFLFQPLKNGSENKSVALKVLFCVVNDAHRIKKKKKFYKNSAIAFLSRNSVPFTGLSGTTFY